MIRDVTPLAKLPVGGMGTCMGTCMGGGIESYPGFLQYLKNTKETDMSYIYLPTAILILFLGYSLFKKGAKEAFAAPQSYQDTLEALYRPIASVICPILQYIIKKLRENPNRNVDTYISLYIMFSDIKEDADVGLVDYPALSYDNLYKMSPNTGDKMILTMAFLEKFMTNTLSTLNQSLEAACTEKAQSPETLSTLKTNLELESFDDISNETKELGYITRISNIFDVYKNLSLPLNSSFQRDSQGKFIVVPQGNLKKILTKLQFLYDELRFIEYNPDSIKPSC